LKIYVKQTNIYERKKSISFGCILRRNCTGIKGKTEGTIEVTGKRGRRPTHLPNGLKKTNGYCKLKEEA
jgi:hypothetical protein